MPLYGSSLFQVSTDPSGGEVTGKSLNGGMFWLSGPEDEAESNDSIMFSTYRVRMELGDWDEGDGAYKSGGFTLLDDGGDSRIDMYYDADETGFWLKGPAGDNVFQFEYQEEVETKFFLHYASSSLFEFRANVDESSFFVARPEDAADFLYSSYEVATETHHFQLNFLPTEDPEVENEVWNDNGTLMISAGAP